MEKENLIIRNEQEKDFRTVENLVRESFWNVYRPGAAEHYVIHRFREDKDFVKELDFVMEKDGKIIGQVIFVKAEVVSENGHSTPVLTLGPICIAPEFKRKGYGKKLLDYSLEKAKEYGAGGVVIEGNIDFYGKSGFIVAKNKGIYYYDDEEADYLLLKELKKGFFDGVKGYFKDPQGYFVCEREKDEFEKFEATFPKKIKEKRDEQIF